MPEGQPISPEEMGIEPEVEAPVKKRSFLDIFHFRRIEPPDSPETADEETSEDSVDWQERVKNLQNPEDFVSLLSRMSAKEYQQMRILEKHEKPISHFRQVLKGELNYELTDDNDIHHNRWNEAIYHGAKILGDKKTLTSAGLMAVVGLIGGAGIPSLAALGGRIAGRAGAELKGARKESGLREEITEYSLKDFLVLSEKANDFERNKDDLSPEEAGERLKDILDQYYNKSEEMLEKEDLLTGQVMSTEKRREKWGNVGGFAGAAGGIATGLSGLTNMIDLAHFHGPAIGHSVRMVDGVYQYAETAAEKAVTNWNTVTELGSKAYHVMGGAVDTAKIYATVVGGLAGFFGGLKWGGKMEEKAKAFEEKEMRIGVEKLASQEVNMRASVTELNPIVAQTPDLGGGGGSSPEVGESMPQAGEIWKINANDTTTIIRIENINQESGMVVVIALDANLNSIDSTKPPYEMYLDYFLSHGSKYESPMASSHVVQTNAAGNDLGSQLQPPQDSVEAPEAQPEQVDDSRIEQKNPEYPESDTAWEFDKKYSLDSFPPKIQELGSEFFVESVDRNNNEIILRKWVQDPDEDGQMIKKVLIFNLSAWGLISTCYRQAKTTS